GSTESVRSIACASVRTLIASAARAGERPTATTVSTAVRQARTKCNRRPPSFTPVDPLAELRRIEAIPRALKASELYVDLRRFRGPTRRERPLKRPPPARRARLKRQEFQRLATLSTIFPICALVSMRACAAGASRARNGAS